MHETLWISWFSSLGEGKAKQSGMPKRKAEPNEGKTLLHFFFTKLPTQSKKGELKDGECSEPASKQMCTGKISEESRGEIAFGRRISLYNFCARWFVKTLICIEGRYYLIKNPTWPRVFSYCFRGQTNTLTKHVTAYSFLVVESYTPF